MIKAPPSDAGADQDKSTDVDDVTVAVRLTTALGTDAATEGETEAKSSENATPPHRLF